MPAGKSPPHPARTRPRRRGTAPPPQRAEQRDARPGEHAYQCRPQRAAMTPADRERHAGRHAGDRVRRRQPGVPVPGEARTSRSGTSRTSSRLRRSRFPRETASTGSGAVRSASRVSSQPRTNAPRRFTTNVAHGHALGPVRERLRDARTRQRPHGAADHDRHDARLRDAQPAQHLARPRGERRERPRRPPAAPPARLRALPRTRLRRHAQPWAETGPSTPTLAIRITPSRGAAAIIDASVPPAPAAIPRATPPSSRFAVHRAPKSPGPRRRVRCTAHRVAPGA